MLDIEKELKRANEVYAKCDSLNHELWQKWLRTGYKLHVADSYLITHSTNILLQKAIYRNGVKLFFVNAWVYVTDQEPHIGISLMPECQFNTHVGQEPAFSVTYMGNTDSPTIIEYFFIETYDKMDCKPED